MNDTIEGEVLRNETTKEVAEINTDATAVASFNPLEAEPVAFARQLQNRQDNYDSLQMHLQGVLITPEDFRRLHIAKKGKEWDECERPQTCTYEANPYHWSPWTLLAPGADKILGILGLAVHYPDLQDYKRAVLKGYEIQEVIVDCQILGLSDQVIAEGAGACARKEVQNSLNNCIKRACKRARLDAVKRLPVVSALFEGDFLAQMAAAQNKNGPNSAPKRAQKVKSPWDTGARLEVCPIGTNIKGMAWRDIETEALEWLVANVDDKPDVTRAAASELSKRSSATDSGSIRTSSSPTSDTERQEPITGEKT